VSELVWRPSWLNYWKAFAAAFILVAGAGAAMHFVGDALEEYVTPWVLPLIGLALGLLVLGRAAVDRLRRKYLVKPDGHVAVRYGIIAKETDEIRVQDIRLLGVNQSLVQRIFGLGDVEIATAGHGDVEILMQGIPDPEAVKEAVRKLQASLGGSAE